MRNPEIVGAIVVGSIIIGAGLFFGLRRSEAPGPAAPQPLASTPSAPLETAPPPSSVQPPPALANPVKPSTPPELAAKAQKSVAAAIQAARPGALAKCWKESPGDSGAAKVKLTWNGTIGPSGTPTAYGISEHRDGFRPGLADCASKALANLSIADAPPQPVEVTVDFELP